MKVIIQRVKEAEVIVKQSTVSKINYGLLIYLGITINDTKEDIDWIINRIYKLSFFTNHKKQLSFSLENTEYEVLIISQFTLYASSKKGKNLSFTKAEKPDRAKELYDNFINSFKNLFDKNRVKTGVFGEFMNIQSNNDGPLTIIIDSKNRI